MTLTVSLSFGGSVPAGARAANLPAHGGGPVNAAPYRWVHPPAERAVGNVPPTGSVVDVAVGELGTGAASVGSSDLQLIASLPSGAIAPTAGASVVSFTVSPVDPAGLGAVPNGLHADGNAYSLAASYE